MSLDGVLGSLRCFQYKLSLLLHVTTKYELKLLGFVLCKIALPDRISKWDLPRSYNCSTYFSHGLHVVSIVDVVGGVGAGRGGNIVDLIFCWREPSPSISVNDKNLLIVSLPPFSIFSFITSSYAV